MNKDNFIMVIIFIAVITSLFIIGVFDFSKDDVDESNNVSVDASNIAQAMNLSQQRIRESYQYNEYEGGDISLVSSKSYECEGCWKISYQYNVDPVKAPANVSKVIMAFEFKDGNIVNTTYSEIVQSDENINRVYCTPEQRNVDACIEIYDPVCGYTKDKCLEGECEEEFSNSCFACQSEEVIYYIKGSC